MEDIAINCNKDTCLYLRNTIIEGMITECVLNKILHHVGKLWIICSNKEMSYEIEENNHPDWFNTSPWYNTAIYSKLHGKLFEYFIRHTKIDRYC